MLYTASQPSALKKGYLVATIGGLLLAVDIPLIRLAQTDAWTTLLIRAPVMFAVFFLFTRFMHWKGYQAPRIYEGRDSLVFASLHCAATICFVFGIFHTTTANLVFITAFSSLISLFLASVFLKEKHPKSTWIAVLSALVGISLITIDDFATNGLDNAPSVQAMLSERFGRDDQRSLQGRSHTSSRALAVF